VNVSGNPVFVDHLLIVCVTVLLPIHDLLFWYPRVVHAARRDRPRARAHAYRESMSVEWALVAVTMAWWALRDRPWEDLGFAAPGGWGFWLGAAIAATIFVVVTRQRLALSRDPGPEVRQAVLAQLEKVRPLLPHSRPELRRFAMVSITAGICEEVLFRGLLIWYLRALVPTVVALALASALFGMAHAYQGTKGVIQTGFVGLGLVILYVLTGSLWVPIAVHAFFDLNSGLLAHAFLGEDDEQEEA
jgi:membrane protease YdiL (CAAX protease family)